MVIFIIFDIFALTSPKDIPSPADLFNLEELTEKEVCPYLKNLKTHV